MLSKFKSVLYGSSNTVDDIHDRKKVRPSLARSASFREYLSRNSLNGSGYDEDDNSIGVARGSRGESNGHHGYHRQSSIPAGAGCQSASQISFSSPYSPDFDSLSPNYSLEISKDYSNTKKLAKFRYTRPEFLLLRTDDEILVSADHQIRPIILPRDVSRLPWKSGYAECINAGKSTRNEDQAASYQDVAVTKSSIINGGRRSNTNRSIEEQIPWVYFGIFDGHAGPAVAVAAAAQLHNIIGAKLHHIAELLIALEFDQELAKVDDQDSDERSESDQEKEKPLFYRKVEDDVVTAEKQVQSETISTSCDSASDSSTKPKRPTSSVDKPTELDDILETAEPIETKLQSTSSLLTCNDAPKKPLRECDTTESGNNHKESQQRPIVDTRHPDPDPYLANLSLKLYHSNITVDKLITGVLESAFWEMDALIERDKKIFKMAGGCTAIVSLFILGKLYVCNAGDSRAIAYKNKQATPMSYDFTPNTERDRILRLGLQRPELLGNEFTHLDFLRRPTRNDLGKKFLYRDAYMTGWSLKTITYNDLRFPLVWGEGKRSRVLATIGVTRGFGDHELRTQYGQLPIKPFLTPEPEVKIMPLQFDETLTEEDVVIMGTDGLWDVTSNEQAAEIVQKSFGHCLDKVDPRSKYRYLTAAQDLVIHSRGHMAEYNGVWRTKDLRVASMDDIAVFVIPLKQYRDEYLEWVKLRGQAQARKLAIVCENGEDKHNHQPLCSSGKGEIEAIDEDLKSPIDNI